MSEWKKSEDTTQHVLFEDLKEKLESLLRELKKKRDELKEQKENG